MIPRFNEAKATQVAARVLSNRGGRMKYLKLIKLLYFIDREALLRWGRPITTDRYVSMDNGPVLSRVSDLSREEVPPGTTSEWRRYISPPDNWGVTLLVSDLPDSELSPAEEELIDEICRQLGTKDRWELVELSHALPEWEDPQGSSIPIDYRDILKAANKTDAEIASIEDGLASLAAVQMLEPR